MSISYNWDLSSSSSLLKIQRKFEETYKSVFRKRIITANKTYLQVHFNKINYSFARTFIHIKLYTCMCTDAKQNIDLPNNVHSRHRY